MVCGVSGQQSTMASLCGSTSSIASTATTVAAAPGASAHRATPTTSAPSAVKSSQVFLPTWPRPTTVTRRPASCLVVYRSQERADCRRARLGSSFTKYSTPVSANSASGIACTPAAVVNVMSLSPSPDLSMNCPIPELDACTQRSRGQLAAMPAGSSQSKSKLTSAAARIDRHRSRSASDRSLGGPWWSAVYRVGGSSSGA